MNKRAPTSRWLFGLAASLVAWTSTQGCSSSDAKSPLPYEPRPAEAIDLGPSLGASFADPLLLTVAAARPRARYLGDQGYTLARSPEGIVSFVTQSAGDFGMAFAVDGKWLLSESDWAKPVEIVATSSDTIVYRFSLLPDLEAEAWFAAVTSGSAAFEVHVRGTGSAKHTVKAVPYVRRCEVPFTKAADLAGGVRASRYVQPFPTVPAIAPGTYVESFDDALVGEAKSWDWSGLAACGDPTAPSKQDLVALTSSSAKPSGDAAAIALAPMQHEVGPGETVPFRAYRAGVDADHGGDIAQEIDRARTAALPALFAEAKARVAKYPAKKPGLTREEALLWHSSFTLLDQLVLPAEGKLHHDYFLFSREPLWWFARFGVHIHEGLALILLAHSDPHEATEVLRNFIDRTEADGYLPYNFGPVVEQTIGRTASAPLFSYVAWEVYRVAKDEAFLKDAYDAGKRIHGFWLRERDTNHNGLFEWGGLAISESLRDLENVVWTNVAQPNEVEAIDLQAEMVVEEQSLGHMADALGLASEGDAWRAEADALAQRINAKMWDDAKGFYFHIGRDSQSFTFKDPNDLERFEIAGFTPLWAGIVPDARKPALLAHLTDPSTFYRKYGVAGLAANDPFFSPNAAHCCRWNGPVWVPWMFLLQRGLVGANEPDLARDLSQRTRSAVIAQLARYHQFRELYDADDATRPNDSMPNYVWSSMATLMLMEE